MNKIKSLILGSAAVIAASAGAQAADLPLKAKAVQYVKICSLYGAGFYYIPGTETCIKLGGYSQFNLNIYGSNDDAPALRNSTAGTVNATAAPYPGDGLNFNARSGMAYTTRARNQLNIDTRTATEYGVVRTFMVNNFEFSTGASPSTGNITTDYAFIQFAGFTFGKAVGTFQTPWGAFGGANNNSSVFFGGYDNATGVTQVAYTWQFGNGISAQLGLEEQTINRGLLIDANLGSNSVAAGAFTGSFAPSTPGYVGYGGQIAPEITGNIRADNAAYTLQVSGAAHLVRAPYYSNTLGFGSTTAIELQTSGHPSDVWGGAASVGLQLKNLPTGPGDKLSLDATYANGAMRYLIGGTFSNNIQFFQGSGGTAGATPFYQNVTMVSNADGVYSTNGSIQKTDGIGFRGAYLHNWSPNWETSVLGSYTKVNFNNTATTAYCLLFSSSTGAKSSNYSCNPDFTLWQIGSRTAWTPVTNLTFSAEVMYTFIDQSFTGAATSVGAAGVGGGITPGAAFNFKDQGAVSGNLRVRRTW